MYAVLLSEGFQAKENEDGDPTKSSHETYARTADCDLAGNALRVCREDWTVSEHRAASLAGSTSACSTDFRKQQGRGIHEPLQNRAQDISRGFCGCRRAQKFARK